MRLEGPSEFILKLSRKEIVEVLERLTGRQCVKLPATMGGPMGSMFKRGLFATGRDLY